MRLLDLDTLPSLDTSTNGLIEEFYDPALCCSVRYDRGVGFFTSKWLMMAAAGLLRFAENGGKARFIVSPYLSPEDLAALAQGEAAKNDKILSGHLKLIVQEFPRAISEQTLSVLVWMVADGLLDFKIALPHDALNGDFHDKFGIFEDHFGDRVAFHGSQNDSAKAFRNYEAISIFYSWGDSREAERVESHSQRFENLWENRDANVRVFALPQAIRQNLIRFTNRGYRPYQIAPQAHLKSAEINKWRHQKEALGAFLSTQNGVLEMATGTGKTRTALNILDELLHRQLVHSIVITMEGTDLMLQWYNELISNFDLPLFRQLSIWKESSDFMACAEPKILLISRSQLKNIIPHMANDALKSALLICDEVHGMGSPTMVRDLSGQLSRFEYRLGLSATPEREYDQDGNDFIEVEIGPTIFQFTLEDAIIRGILCEFDYHPIHYEVSDDDRAAIRQAIKRHHGRKASGENQPDEVLFREIAMVRKTTIEKIAPFEIFLTDRDNILKNCLIFVETAAFGTLVQPILMAAGVPYHTYYQSEHAEKLKQFTNGKLDCLVSCHRLSEGIDIQSVENIVLFSSSSARLETVQRLGRCLRTDPTNPNKRALVIDFVDFDGGKNSTDIDRHDWFLNLASVKDVVGNSGKERK